jgi:hypothetical protein
MGRQDLNRDRRACLEEADRGTGKGWRTGGIKPEVVQRAEANCIRVLVLGESFRVPGDRVWGGLGILSQSPRSATVSGVILRAILCKTGMLRRGVKSFIAHPRPETIEKDLKGLNAAIQVLVIDGILIVPHAVIWSCYFVTYEEDTIVARIGFDLINRRTSPSHDGWLLSHGRTCGIEGERLVDSNYGELLVRSVVIHVALRRVTLAPDAFIRDDVFRFGKIGRPRVQRRVQVINGNQHPVRGYVVNMAGVVVRCIT